MIALCILGFLFQVVCIALLIGTMRERRRNK